MAKSEYAANLSLEEMRDARIDALIAKKIKMMRQARRAQRLAPTLGELLSGRATLAQRFNIINGR